MSDQPVRTIVETSEGELAFQDYFVRRRCEPKVRGFRFEGAAQAVAIAAGRGCTVRPGTARHRDLPVESLCERRTYPRGRRHPQSASAATTAPILAVSPIVAGRAIKGPAAKMMAELGGPVSGLIVARLYAELIDGMVLDEQDHALARRAPRR